MRTMTRRFFSMTALGWACLALTGCIGYQLGSMLPKDIKTVYVPNIVNSTSEPNVEAEITRAIVQEIQRDGSLEIIGDPDAADSVLSVELTRYALNPIAYNNDRASQAEEYRIQLYAKAVLIRRSTGEVIAEAVNLYGRTEFFFNSDLTTAKQQNLDDAADDLASEIVQMIVEIW